MMPSVFYSILHNKHIEIDKFDIQHVGSVKKYLLDFVFKTVCQFFNGNVCQHRDCFEPIGKYMKAGWALHERIGIQ